MDRGEITIVSSSLLSAANKLEFTETYVGSNVITYYTLEELDETRTKLTFNYYTQKRNFFTTIAYKQIRKREIEAEFGRSFLNLREFLKEFKVPCGAGP